MNEVIQVRMNGWAAMVKQKKESGMTVKEWRAANGISQHAYYYRLRQLRKGLLEKMQPVTEEPSPQFHKVESEGSFDPCCLRSTVLTKSTLPADEVICVKELMVWLLLSKNSLT